MNPKAKLFWWQLAMVIITLAIFFITDAMNSGVILTRLIVALVLFTMFAALGAAKPAAIAGGIAMLATFIASAAGLWYFVIFIASVVCIIIMIVLTTVFYINEDGFTKKHVLISVVGEFLIILIPMLWYIITHQEQIKAAIGS